MRSHLFTVQIICNTWKFKNLFEMSPFIFIKKEQVCLKEVLKTFQIHFLKHPTAEITVDFDNS